MNNLLITICTLGLLASAAHAKELANLSRGGYGFLFSDANSFINGGQMANITGTAVEAHYTRHDHLKTQTATPSVVWGSGRVGLGAFASRTGESLIGSESSQSDSIGAGLGVSLERGRVTLGGTINRSIDTQQTGDGTVSIATNYNGAKGRGFHMGAGFSTSLNSDSGTESKTATLAMGWGFSAATFEANYKLKDLDQTNNNYQASGYLNFGGANYYISTGYIYDKPSEQSSLSGRIGYVTGMVDFSIHSEHTVENGQSPYYGATLRSAF